MLGKTHMAVGIAAALAFTQPKGVSDIIIASGVGALGALISDIDVGTSNSHKEANKVAGLFFVVLAVMWGLDYILKIGIMEHIMQNSSLFELLFGSAAFILICLYGKGLPHRSFMHSFLALALLSSALALIYVPFVPYFAVGFLSHLATDILNYKRVRLLYPLKKGFRLGLFHAHGIANHLLFLVASSVSIAQIIVILFG